MQRDISSIEISGPTFLWKHHALFFAIARRRLAVTDGQILQLAFAALVADRAVERMVDQQEFHHSLLALHRLVRLGAHDHAGRHRRRARGHGLRHLLDIDQTHPAVGRNRQLLVIAEVRNVGVDLMRSLDHHAAFRHLDFLAVYFQFNHDGQSSLTCYRSIVRLFIARFGR
ncbi:hypothetical protein QFZ94_005108 [Paraburkholderia sp. JPY465]